MQLLSNITSILSPSPALTVTYYLQSVWLLVYNLITSEQKFLSMKTGKTKAIFVLVNFPADMGIIHTSLNYILNNLCEMYGWYISVSSLRPIS